MTLVAHFSNLEVHQLPAFEDNYLYIVFNRVLNKAWMIDPGDYSVLESWRHSQSRGVRWEGALVTHHHHDHIGALPSLMAEFPELKVCGSPIERAKVPLINQPIDNGSQLEILGASVQVISLPGHTKGLVAYHFPVQGWIFVGDALFAMGCGRLFEGSYEDLLNSLAQLKSLAPQTLVFSAHEYTEKNARFALELEPHNQALQERWIEIKSLRGSNKATVPFTLQAELETNPFLRLDSLEIHRSLGLQKSDALTVLKVLREKRNHF